MENSEFFLKIPCFFKKVCEKSTYQQVCPQVSRQLDGNLLLRRPGCCRDLPAVRPEPAPWAPIRYRLRQSAAVTAYFWPWSSGAPRPVFTGRIPRRASEPPWSAAWRQRRVSLLPVFFSPQGRKVPPKAGLNTTFFVEGYPLCNITIDFWQSRK